MDNVKSMQWFEESNAPACDGGWDSEAGAPGRSL
jgi:hypothetical protein